jgi:glucose-1-phosphate thymidylyltransferase
MDIIGLVPAAGEARRLISLPCSKEILPIGFATKKVGDDSPPKVIAHYLLEDMRHAGASIAYIIIDQGKWDILTYFGDGSRLGMNFAYLMKRLPYGVPYTLDQAYKFIKNEYVVFGFPDVLFEPRDAFYHLLEKQMSHKADIVLGLFPVDETLAHRVDMIALDQEGKITEILIKPKQTNLNLSWIIATWSPAFTQFMHDYLIHHQQELTRSEKQAELYMGTVIQAAIVSSQKLGEAHDEPHPIG